MPAKIKRDGNFINVKFKNFYKGLKLNGGSEARTFEVGDENGKFFAANAKIASKDSVQVEIPKEVLNPVKIRYAWAADPDVNLYNSGDLPASPFEENIEN